MKLKHTPIQRRLMGIILGTSAVVLFLTCAAFLGYEYLTFRQTSVQDLSTLSEIIASNSTAVLAFDNPEDAKEVLNSIRAQRHVVAASLYDRTGRLFAKYPATAPDSFFPAAPQDDGFRFANGFLIGFTPVIQASGGPRLGTLYLKADRGAMYERLRLYAGIAFLIIAVLSLVAYVLSRKLQQQISRPILTLVETATAVSNRNDYSVRAVKLGTDELGVLTDAFNQMLEHIQEQNLALKRAYDDLRQTQEASMQQERLRALGQMASGIAHDINNAISPASLYVESVLEKEPGMSGRSREYLTTVQRAIDDVAETVSRLREFCRKREPALALAAVDVNRLVEQVERLTKARWSDMARERSVTIDMRLELGRDLPPILCIESEIREALTNLVFNAVDAMPQGGTIIARTHLYHSHDSDDDLERAQRLCVELVDSGVGMDEETRRRCLEPFFTTKGERGTGLGLAMVYGTLQRHRGHIEIDSAPGKGTTVRLLFPLSQTVIEPRKEVEPEMALSGPLRILLVDDDRLILKSLQAALEDDGHAVTAANGGQAGIDTFKAALGTAAAFSVVISDLGLPDVDGRQVAAAVKQASPTTPLFLLTGWGHQLEDEGQLPANVDLILSKPPKLRELREALATVHPPGLIP